MNKTLLVTAAVIALIGGTCITSYISAANYGKRATKQIEAQHEDMQNVLSSYSLKIKEAAQIPDMYIEDLKEVYTGVMEGRYGENGSKAMFQWIQEQNPTVDSSLYVKLQQIIEAGRTEFKNSQTKLLDMKRAYETNVGYVWTGFWMGLAGYSEDDVEQYKIIKAENVRQAFESGTDSVLNIGGK